MFTLFVVFLFLKFNFEFFCSVSFCGKRGCDVLCLLHVLDVIRSLKYSDMSTCLV